MRREGRSGRGEDCGLKGRRDGCFGGGEVGWVVVIVHEHDGVCALHDSDEWTRIISQALSSAGAGYLLTAISFLYLDFPDGVSEVQVIISADETKRPRFRGRGAWRRA